MPALHIGGAHDVAADLCAIEMDGVDKLAEIILGIGVIEIEQVEMTGGVVQGSAHDGHTFLIEMVEGDQRGAIPCPVREMGNDLLCGVLLCALQKVRGGGGREHPVFQHHVADFDGAEQRFVFEFHNSFLSLCQRHTFL